MMYTDPENLSPRLNLPIKEIQHKMDELTLAKGVYLFMIGMIETGYLIRIKDQSKRGLLDKERLFIKTEEELKGRLDKIITQLAHDAEEIDPEWVKGLLEKFKRS